MKSFLLSIATVKGNFGGIDNNVKIVVTVSELNPIDALELFGLKFKNHPLLPPIYINKEELKMVVRDILACAQPNCHKTFTALWNPYRRVSSRGQCAQIRYSRGACGEKPEKTTVRHFGFTEKVYGLPCTVRTLLVWKRHLEMPSWELT